MAQSEKRYCPICRQKTTFICQPSGCFCSKCGYKEEKEAGGKMSQEAMLQVLEKAARDINFYSQLAEEPAFPY